MEMVEVDVKLFIKCRMCLDEDGVYQIVPSIRELIKDCFDIDTDPFDGLPQLICKKCKTTLSDYHGIKTTYKLKQLKLKERLVKIKNNCTQLKSETGSSNEINKNEEKPTSPVPLGLAITNISPVQPVSSVAPVKSVEHVASVQLGMPIGSDIQAALDDSEIINDETWKRTYNECYFCKICTKSYKRYASIKRHVKSHKKLLKKHKRVFRKYCTVHLNKIDNKENCTGSSNMVVYNTDKIITSRGNSHYHLLYVKKDYSTGQATSENGNASDKRPGIFLDSEEEIVKCKKRKTRRLYSGSSTKTTILEDTANDITVGGAKNDTHVMNTNCANEASSKKKIDTENTTNLSQQEVAKANIANYKAIQNIVTMCQKKYITKAQSKSETKPPVSESSLKHKVLSLGRKVINKQGFECTGLLRYMEYKDLEISWQPTTRSNKKKSSNFVRIMTKLKSREDLENDDSSWKDLHKVTFVSNQAIDGDDINTDGIDPANITAHDNEKSTLKTNLLNGEDQIDHILTNNCDDLNSKNKLLNKTPVANPKQLPKKIMPEIKPTTIKTSDVPMVTSENGRTENAEVTNSNLCMPIITSTCSLSTVVEKEKQPDPVIEKPAPRIKVKPPSELMSQSALNNQSKSEDIWAFNKRHASLPYHFPNTAVYAGVSVYQTQVENQTNDVSVVPSPPTITGNSNSGTESNVDYVTLHCLECPNEKTKFPFLYFKRVLQFHGFELLDINEALPPHYTCLITYKLLLKQDTKGPLGIWLSLFCSNNSFCFAFKDSNSKKFNPNHLPAFWQWELLKIYKGDVVEKILQNALKVSKEVYSYTNNFLCLLKSIKCISEP
ncbi:uncharacterized protein [Choristoneura fumiferana]|uniref:uncharacterized protein n=1 Tax=Choristoneura fumiferana TaxID=7141 RepID=UPI003D15DCCE